MPGTFTRRSLLCGFAALPLAAVAKGLPVPTVAAVRGSVLSPARTPLIIGVDRSRCPSSDLTGYLVQVGGKTVHVDAGTTRCSVAVDWPKLGQSMPVQVLSVTGPSGGWTPAAEGYAA